jgi:ribose transport system permease protein
MQTDMERQPLGDSRLGVGGVFKKIPIILWGLLVLLLVLGIVSPSSVEPVHLLDFVRQAAPLIIVALGQTLVLLIGGLDLSVGATITLTGIVAAQLMAGDPSNAVWVAVICVLIGAFIGLINGILCAKFKMPAFVVTLGMAILLLGVTLMISGGSPKGSIPDNFRFWGTGFIGGIPSAAFVWVGIAVLLFIVITFFPIGRYIYSIGVNARSARLAGINDVKFKILCYVASGSLAAISGLVLAAYIGTGSLTVGDDYQLRSIAAAILGGAAFEGGKGNIQGTVIASLFLIVMFSLIGVLNMDAGDRSIIQGAIILLGLFLNNVNGGGIRRLFKSK